MAPSDSMDSEGTILANLAEPLNISEYPVNQPAEWDDWDESSLSSEAQLDLPSCNSVEMRNTEDVFAQRASEEYSPRKQRNRWKGENRRRGRYQNQKKAANLNYDMVWDPLHPEGHTEHFGEHRRVEEPLFKTAEEIHYEKQAMRIHGIPCGDDDFPSDSDSDSGKSSFDEEYYKNKPQPIEIDRSRVVVIEKREEVEDQKQFTHGQGDLQPCYTQEQQQLLYAQQFLYAQQQQKLFYEQQQRQQQQQFWYAQQYQRQQQQPFFYHHPQQFLHGQQQLFRTPEELQLFQEQHYRLVQEQQQFLRAQQDLHFHHAQRQEQFPRAPEEVDVLQAQEEQQLCNTQNQQLFCDGQSNVTNAASNDDTTLFTNENIVDKTEEKTIANQIILVQGLVNTETNSEESTTNNINQDSSCLGDNSNADSTTVDMPESDTVVRVDHELAPTSPESMRSLNLVKCDDNKRSTGEISNEPRWRAFFCWCLSFFCCFNETEA